MSHIIKSVDAFSHQGFKGVDTPNHYNEDRLYLGTNVFAVIDGATALNPIDMDGLNPSAYTSRFIAEFLGQQNQTDKRSANGLLIDCNAALRADLMENWPEIYALGKKGPSAAVAVVKFHGDNRLSVSNAADCAVVALKDGAWNMLSQHYDRHSELDAQLAETIYTLLQNGMDYQQARAEVQPIIAGNRELANVEYGAFNPEPDTVDFLRHNVFDISGVEAIALLTDGLQWPDEADMGAACEMAAQKMHEFGVRAYHDGVKSRYDEDPTFEKYRRLKHIDDASGIVITLRPTA